MIKKIKSFMPKISDTERTALECGTISIDGDIFKGNKPNVSPTLTSMLSKAELEFLNTIVPVLLELQRNTGYTDDNSLHPEVMAYLKHHRFFSMIIPSQYGGLGFSPEAQSLVVTKIASAGYIGLAVTVMPIGRQSAPAIKHRNTIPIAFIDKIDRPQNNIINVVKGISCFDLRGRHKLRCRTARNLNSLIFAQNSSARKVIRQI